MQLHVKVAGLEQLQAKLKDVPAELNHQERALMHQAVIMVRDEVRAQIHSPLGRAARGITADVQDLPGSKIFGRVRSNNLQAVFSQRSRGADKKMPPPRRIRRWLIRMGGDPSPAVAFLVARSIGRRGTTGRPVMQAAYDAKSSMVRELFMNALREAVRKIAGG